MKRLFSTSNKLLRVIAFPITWLFRTYPIEEKAIDKFADWFSGGTGFKQQTVLMGVWIEGAIQGWIYDPHLFTIMAFLTIYSAITQPILAKVSDRAIKILVELIQEIRTLVAEVRAQNVKITELQQVNIHQTQALIEVISKLTELERRDASQLENILDVVRKDE